MRPAALLCLLLLAASPLAAADTHPFSIHDMLAMDRIAEPRVSPDGTRVAFTVRVTGLEGNRGRTDVWLAATDGLWARRLTSHEAADSQGRWAPDGKSLYFVSTRGGSSQVYGGANLLRRCAEKPSSRRCRSITTSNDPQLV